MRRRAAAITPVFVLLLATAALEGAAQTAPRYGGFIGGMALRVRDLNDGRDVSFTSDVPIGEGFVWLGRFLIEGYYAQGKLTPQVGSSADRDFVEGRLLAGYRVASALTLKLGPHARSYVLPSGTRRRVFWELRGTISTPLAGEVAFARLDFWGALAGQSNLSETVDHARGGEAALQIHIPRSPVWAKLGYRVERAQLDDGTRADTIEGLILAIGIGMPAN